MSFRFNNDNKTVNESLNNYKKSLIYKKFYFRVIVKVKT